MTATVSRPCVSVALGLLFLCYCGGPLARAEVQSVCFTVVLPNSSFVSTPRPHSRLHCTALLEAAHHGVAHC